jgi:hypothetical protein
VYQYACGVTLSTAWELGGGTIKPGITHHSALQYHDTLLILYFCVVPIELLHWFAFERVHSTNRSLRSILCVHGSRVIPMPLIRVRGKRHTVTVTVTLTEQRRIVWE